jgi:hypothetical protein
LEVANSRQIGDRSLRSEIGVVNSRQIGDRSLRSEIGVANSRLGGRSEFEAGNLSLRPEIGVRGRRLEFRGTRTRAVTTAPPPLPSEPASRAPPNPGRFIREEGVLPPSQGTKVRTGGAGDSALLPDAKMYQNQCDYCITHTYSLLKTSGKVSVRTSLTLCHLFSVAGPH